jgi:cytochrome c-type biogenesis protein CcmH
VSRRLAWLGLAVVLFAALGVGSQGRSGPPTQEQRVHRITSVMRCPTCRGLSVAQSDAPSAEAIRDEVRRRVQDGQTDAQIKAFLVSRYPDILLSPEAKGVGLLVWALPVVAVAAAVTGVTVVVRRRRVGPRRRASAADRALVERALRS